MHSDKDGEPGEEYIRRRNETERRHRGGESVERRHRNSEKEFRHERDYQRERDRTRERGKQPDGAKDRYLDRRKEGSSDRREDKDMREKDRERRRERDKYGGDYQENRDRRRETEERENQEKDRERERERERNRDRERERHDERDRDKRREERDMGRRREERDREHRGDRERRRHEESGDGERDRTQKHDREQRDRHREKERLTESERYKAEYKDRRSDKERQERHTDRKRSEQKEERGYKDEHRKDKEDRERRYKDRGQHDEKRRHGSESREQRDWKGSSGDQRDDRERAERDKHRERRHREQEGPERSHRDRTGTSKPASDQSHSHEAKTAETKVANDEDLAADQDYGDYEDDFEKLDYEEDFEELDESADEGEGEGEKEPHHPEVREEKEQLTARRREEIKAIQRAMHEENERAAFAQTRQSTSTEEEDRPKRSRESDKNRGRNSQRGKFIDFVAAKQREVSKKVANKQKKRSTELLRLIDLDFSVTFSLLDLQPVNEYDMYIKSFGTANTKQAYVQCNEDNADRDIQTEEVEVCEKWTQHPPERSGACGDPNLSQEARDKSMSAVNIDSQRLTAFLRSASQVMVVLLEEDQAERKSLQQQRTQTDVLSFSDSSLQINTKLPFLYDRQVSLLHFSQVQRQTMMSVHSPAVKPSSVRLDSFTIICIWNIWEPSRPQKILIYESEVQCCCFSPGKASLVFAGTSVGSVVLWDLREHASNHYCLKIGDDEWTFRHPTFSTDAILAGSGHLSSVSSVEVVPSTVAGGLRPEVPLLASEEESSGLSFQLASLDETGLLNLWVVVELPKANSAGSQTDLGLRPGGKVKLLHSSSLVTAERISPRDAKKTGPLQTLLLKFLPTDSNHFFIGTNMGLVNHGTSHGLKAPPKFYRFQEVGGRPVDVSAMHFSPFRQHLFLVGCGDGNIRLHAVSHEQPLAEWKSSTAGEPVVCLQWAQTRPTVFCVLDAASNLHIWDLLKNDLEPVITERMNADRVTAMAVFGDTGQQNTYSGLALAHESGKIEMQYFTRNFTMPSSAEEEKLESMMNEAF
ncbi:WD repeat-containing protein 60 isoform X3 [Myripristis murdjan]|uniref:WD repeat-containing protein 60 isoform X3 n=1 Tax=Myripristis murdjan TaxID=586833 RepID=UPI001175FBEF|nr:WD repeat-containing protein 60 isoform X3 [Myripristis murdjan]